VTKLKVYKTFSIVQMVAQKYFSALVRNCTLINWFYFSLVKLQMDGFDNKSAPFSG
jgi:hypothetical protein